MSNLEAHHHLPTKIVAHPLSNMFILLSFWFFLHVGLFCFLFIGPRATPPANFIAIFLWFLLVGTSLRSSDALRKSIFHSKRWWIHLLFDFFLFLFLLFFSFFIACKVNSQFFFLWLSSPLVIPWHSLSSITMNCLLPTFSSPFYFCLVPFLGGKSEASC